MNRYGIVDIGSNTIVLIIYEIVNGIPENRKYISTPVHLIDYVKDGQMSSEGIEKAYETLQKYVAILDEEDIQMRYADITEPCRIQNRDELVNRLSSLAIEIHPLSGEEEARFDFVGASLSYPDISEGIAFDIGGGSTELISFADKTILAAMSFPLGCIRLSHLPLDTDKCEASVLQAKQDYPALARKCRELIGIGGTVRAVKLVTDDLFSTGDTIWIRNLKELFLKLRNNDETAMASLKKLVDPARQPYILPGIHMMIVIADQYEAEMIRVSETGIREGFLLEMTKDRQTY